MMERTSKALFLCIAILHIMVLIVFSLCFKPSLGKQKKLQLREVRVVTARTVEPKIERLPNPIVKKPIVKKTTPASKQNPSLSTHSSFLLEKAKKEMASFSSNRMERKETLVTPPKIEQLAIDHPILHSRNNDEKDFRDLFVRDLKRNLKLPEFGEVRMQLCLSSSGKIVDFSVLSSMSKNNENYLKKNLPLLHFPWFNQFTSGEKVIAITFTNEDF